MTNDQMDRLALLLTRVQTGEGSGLGNLGGTAPFTVQFGYVDTICRHDGVVITNAPPKLVTEVTNWADDQTPHVSVSVAYGGLCVR